MSEKKPRLVYWEETCDSWIPAPERVSEILEATNLCEQEEEWLKFKRVDMTDEQWNNFPDL